MSTKVEIPGRVGGPVFVTFTKTASEGWRFTWGANEFVAWKDPAGFTNRAWNLFFIDPKLPKAMNDRVIDDNLASRAAAVESAIEWSRFH